MAPVWNARRNNCAILLHLFNQLQDSSSIADETILIYMEYEFGLFAIT